MLSQAQRSQLAGQLVTMRILVGAMAAGVLVFLVLALAMASGRPDPESRISHGAVLVACLAAIACAIVPRLVTRSLLSAAAHGQAGQSAEPGGPAPEGQSAVGPLLGLYQTRLLVSAAILEGAALLNIVAYVLEKQPLSIAVAVILLLLMLVQFPSQRRVEDWVTRQLQDIDQHVSI